ncbi:MAG TPA: MBL fold metallo-hydrolase [Arcobacter sp.]|nr:MBL fold metallo-hydrolase [Arcobacter sp.]
MGIRFEFFEAGCGDSIWVETENTNILIDGGLTSTYRKSIQRKLSKVQFLDKVIVTHIDNDHICGVIALIKDNLRRKKIKELWFNSCDVISVNSNNKEIGTGQSILLEKLLLKHNVNYRSDIYLSKNNFYSLSKDLTLTLLSPKQEDLEELKKKLEDEDAKYCNGRLATEISSKKCSDNRIITDIEFIYERDTSLNNKTSIAFILDYKYQQKFLFLADAHIDIIIESLQKLGYSKKNRLKVDFVKLSHHGSKHNINEKFLELIDTSKFVTLTNCSKFEHPDKDTYSLIINNEFFKEKKIEFIFNYKSSYVNKFSQEDFKNKNFTIKHTKEI